MPSRRSSTALAACTLAASFAQCGAAARASEAVIFADGPGSTIDANAEGWHSGYEKEGDYAESWFFMIQPQGGGLLIVTLFITNLGLSTFDGGYDFAFYGSHGERAAGHKEVGREHVEATKSGLDVRIDQAHAWRDERGIHVAIDEPTLTLAVHLAPELPAQQFGDGRIVVEGGKLWSHGMMAPRARTSGTLRSAGVNASLDGAGYYDHSVTTVKLPSLLSGWRTLRIFGERLSLVLHEQQLAKRFGGRAARFGILALRDDDGPLALTAASATTTATTAMTATRATTSAPKVVALRDFTYTPLRMQHDEAAGSDYPTELSLAITAEGYRVRGTIRQTRFLEALDVLGQLSWPVRTAIRAFYAKPFSLRYLGRYELDVTTPAGATTHVTGEAPLEANFY